MKRAFSFFILLSAAFSLTSAQVWTPFLKVDTVTTGECDDFHPVLYHSVFNSEMEYNPWMVFERQSNTESMIAGKKFITDSASWDTAVTIISSGPITEEQRYPDLATIPYSSGGRINKRILAAWQQKTDTVWNIFYSTVLNDSARWANPLPLTSDTGSNTMVHVCPFQDSTFILTWKHNNVVLYSLLSPTVTSPAETLAVSNFDAFEYDFIFSYNTGGIVWTERDTSGEILLLERTISTYPSFTLSGPETLSARGDISNPRYIFSIMEYDYTSVLYEEPLGGNHNIYMISLEETTSLTNDPTADYRNARTYISPVITKPMTKNNDIPFQVFVVERRSDGDSSLLFEQGTISRDTVRSIGYNRNASIGGWYYYFSQFGAQGIPVVWESNRSGRSHIYSRFALIVLYAVHEKNISVNNFQLSQNYPNPFNPSTVIHFQLSSDAPVTLKIFDLLGREVQTLVEQKLTAGDYSAKWDGTRFASGVYFYRLQAGDFVQTKKLLLMK